MKKNKIKIAFFLHSLQGAGAERNVVNLVNNLNKEKYQISLVLGKAEGVFISEIPKEVLIIDFKTSYLFSLFFKLLRYFRRERPDIFVSGFPHMNSISIIAKIFSGVKTKIVITEHTTYSLIPATARTFVRKIIARFFLPLLMKAVYLRAEAIICVSKGVARDIVFIVGFSPKIKTIYNPVVNEKIYKLAGEPIEHPWFSQKEIPILLAVGRLSKAKDYPSLFRAFKLIIPKQPVRLVILGEGIEEVKLKKLISKLGLSENVAFLGFQKNPYKYMKKASVFVLSSIREGFGDVIVEAMACGLPIVSTSCAGPSEIIENFKNGILVPGRDEKLLSRAILELLTNPVLREKFSQEGKRRAQDFTVERSVKEYEKVFEEIF